MFKSFCSFFVLFTASSSSFCSDEFQDDERLIYALIQVESGGDDNVIGDKHLRNKAYGCLQIRQPCVDDVKVGFGMPNLKAQDCLGNCKLSIRVFHAYMTRYATEKRLGRKPTDEDRARIWNGGPNGWKKESTKKYWLKVKKELEQRTDTTALMSDIVAVFLCSFSLVFRQFFC